MICLVDERISAKCERALLLRGFRVIKLPPSESLSEAVASHPDMLTFCHGNKIIASADYCERYPWVFTDIRELSNNAEFLFTSDVFMKEYPRDAIFNALLAKEYILLKEDTVSKSVLEYAKQAGLTPVSVKQGYPACTALVFGGGAITSDRGMCDALSRCGLEVTLINNGDILLPPYEYGFIGGASGVLGDKVYFLGDIMKHRDAERICEAIKRQNYTPVSLSDEPLADLGRIIFID